MTVRFGTTVDADGYPAINFRDPQGPQEADTKAARDAAIVAALAAKADASALTAHVSDTANPHSVTKAQVGLGSVDDVQQPTGTWPRPTEAFCPARSGPKSEVVNGRLRRSRRHCRSIRVLDYP